MMKKVTKLLAGLFLFVAVSEISAQASQDCNIKYNLMKGNVNTKKYAEAKPDLEWLLTNCPTLSVNIYKYGSKVADNLKDHDLTKKIYEGRIANYPDSSPAKVHSDYATYLIENKLASDDEVFNILEKAYKISPEEMSAKNIFRFFKMVLEKNKDTNPQKVFDTYDEVMESVEAKLEDYNKKIVTLRAKETEGTLSKKESLMLRRCVINSKASGQVEGGLDAMISEIATCDRLIPLLSKDFEEKKKDAVWLRRAVSRLHHKECQSDPLYAKLAKAYAEASPSSDSYNFLAGVLDKNGDAKGAAEMRKKAFDLETDPSKKARLKLMEAQDSYSKSNARSLAYEALKFNPSMGKAYLFIASLYARSANDCGKDEFEKRMVYVAALNKALKARQVDPGCGAGRYIVSYQKNIPNKKLIFQKGIAPGTAYKINCWIGETVNIP